MIYRLTGKNIICTFGVSFYFRKSKCKGDYESALIKKEETKWLIRCTVTYAAESFI